MKSAGDFALNHLSLDFLFEFQITFVISLISSSVNAGNHYEWEPSMGEVIAVGLDIAKSVFQAHGVDVDGTVVIRKRISRSKSRGTLGSLAMFAAERLVAR
jgi:hypothetical protein